ncbi:dna-binding prophage protein [Leptolyngbya sp. Heron Island J]|uniref:helix-turn-helix domain-containing transcriptional regulator n=1 Tax=Leptolyngbya sp. Heron Island J TaxID=1385935 RepID=UPI0003B968BF|nr:transcriptional regulator [Leptolyngbya sp. Heron Island J]ESA36541.1 dna-binding prophage protein [Leptolyngbya sp. Heron Island J]
MPVKDYRDDQLKRLSDPEYSSQYLKVALDETLQDGNMEAFLLALKNVVDAAGAVKAVAEDADISRQHLHRLLSGNGNPTLETTVSILNAVGLTIDIKPLENQIKI